MDEKILDKISVLMKENNKELLEKMETMRTELKDEIQDVRTELKEDINSLRDAQIKTDKKLDLVISELRVVKNNQTAFLNMQRNLASEQTLMKRFVLDN